jgi:hypothetical protein
MFTTFQKSAAGLLLGMGALLVAAGWVADGGKDTKNCCDLSLACCAANKACCTDKTKAGCCDKGMACCKADKACCAKAPACCEKAKACCDEAKACCSEKVKQMASATAACCAGKTLGQLNLTPGDIQ